MRKHATTPRPVYSFRLDRKNVEKVSERVGPGNLSAWVDKQFENEANMVDWNDEQKMVWRRWLAEQPDAVREVASAYPPTKTYTGTGIPEDTYTVHSYDTAEDGAVTLTLLRESGGIVSGVDPKQIQPVA